MCSLGKLILGKPYTAEASLTAIQSEGELQMDRHCVPLFSMDFEGNALKDIKLSMLEHGDNLPLADKTEVTEDYLLANLAAGARKLNFVKVRLGGVEFAALVDSGAARSFISLPVKEHAERMGFKIKRGKPGTVLSPLGIREMVDEEVKLPIHLLAHNQKINFRVLPSMGMPCILGVDALRAFGLSVYFREDTCDLYNFDTDPTHYYRFFTEAFATGNATEVCAGLQILTEEQKESLRKFLEKELAALSEATSERRGTTLATHHIDVGEAQAIKQRYYPFAPAVEKAMQEEVDKMLKEGIIEPSSSDWSSPVVMIKRNEKYRFCLDFRKVNSVTKKDAYPLPYMSAILDKLRMARYISTLDLSKAFNQVPLRQASQSRLSQCLDEGYFSLNTCRLVYVTHPPPFRD